MAITTVSQHVVSVNAIQGTLIADNAITAVHIATNAVSGTLIADNAITATHIAQNVITVTQLADDAVEAAKIADGVITTNHLNKAMISSQTEVTAVAGDFLLIGDTSDSNNLKKIPISGITSLVSTFDADGAQVFNESGAAVDFRIEGDTEQNLLFVDGSADKIGIGTSSPTEKLQVNGAIRSTGNAANTPGVADSGVFYFIPTADDGSNPRTVISGVGTSSVGGHVTFKTGTTSSNTEKMRITSDGHVGIGITSPNEGGFGATSNVLSIAGTAQDAFGVLELISTDVTSSNRIGEIRFGNLDAGSSFASNAGMRATRAGADNSSALSLWTTNAGTFAEALHIDNLGNLSSPATGGHVQIDNGIGVTTRETMAATGHAWQSNTYNVLTAGSTSIGTDSSGTTHMWFNSYDTGSKYSVKAGHSADLYHGITDGQFVLRMSSNSTTTNGEGITMLQRLYIDKDGTFQFHSAGTNDTTIKFYKGASTIKWWMQNDTSGSPGSDSFWIGDEENDNGVYVQQDGASWSGISDERLKRSWTNLTNATDKIDTLTKVGTFQRRGKSTGKWSDNREVGLSAQEVEAILPEAVNTGGDLEFASDDKVTGVKGMSYEKLVPLLVKAIQELNTRLKAVE